MCPVCASPMIIVELQGVEVDHCPACRGTWFDSGELELVAEIAGIEPERLRGVLLPEPGARAGTRRCPRCGRRMQPATVGPREPVHIDRCPDGDGVWLDAGELASVVRNYHEGDLGKLAEFFGDMFRSELEHGR